MSTDNLSPLPTSQDQELAKRLQRSLARLQDSGEVCLQAPCGEETIKLPTAVVGLLQRILTEMADGNAVTLVPIHAELTTSEAAGLLNVSRPHLVSLLKAGELPHIKVGSHRRILARDVLAYRDKVLGMRRRALTELTQEAERLGLGY